MEKNSVATARLCRIAKAASGYGFHLHSDKARSGQFVRKIEPGSAAEAAGVRPGDRILEVNGVNVESKSHQEVVAIVKQKPLETTLLVVDEESDKALAERREAAGQDAPPASLLEVRDTSKGDGDGMESGDDRSQEGSRRHGGSDASEGSDAQEDKSTPRPRLCPVTRGPKGYGFHLHTEKGRVGQFIRAVDPGSPAHQAGILPQDRIVEVNGQSITGKKHAEVVSLVKSGGEHVTLLLVDRAADEFFARCGVEPAPGHVTGRLPKPLSNGTLDTEVDGKRESADRESREREEREREREREKEEQEREERERQEREREEREREREKEEQEREEREREEREREKEEREREEREREERERESEKEEREREEREREERKREEREREERERQERERAEREAGDESDRAEKTLSTKKSSESDHDSHDSHDSHGSRDSNDARRNPRETRGQSEETEPIGDRRELEERRERESLERRGCLGDVPAPRSPGFEAEAEGGGGRSASPSEPPLAATLELARERAQAQRRNKRAPAMDWSKRKELFSKF